MRSRQRSGWRETTLPFTKNTTTRRKRRTNPGAQLIIQVSSSLSSPSTSKNNGTKLQSLSSVFRKRLILSASIIVTAVSFFSILCAVMKGHNRSNALQHHNSPALQRHPQQKAPVKNPYPPLPADLQNNLADIMQAKEETDVPIFFHIPKSGGSTIKRILGECLDLVEASRGGVEEEGHGEQPFLTIVQLHDGGLTKYVNVDTTTSAGILRAKEMKLIQSNLADVIVTSLFTDITTLFHELPNKGRTFALFRHPIDRAVSLFYYLQYASWETTYDKSLQSISIEDWAKSDRAENNWMIRFLTNTPRGPLTSAHLDLSKNIVESKILIGLVSQMERSVTKFMNYFGWRVRDKRGFNCQNRLIHRGDNRHPHPKVIPGTKTWELLAERNRFDLQLYEFVEELFEEQERTMHLDAKLLP